MKTRLTPRELLYMHYRLVERVGGRHGVREVRPLQEALERLSGSRGNSRDKPHEKAALLLHSLIYEYPFVDGNKVTAFAAALLMLELEGYSVSVSCTDAKDLIAKVATGQYTVDDTARWLSERIGGKRSRLQS